MTANQRRSSFRLPWTSDAEETGDAAEGARSADSSPATTEPGGTVTPAPASNGTEPAPVADAAPEPQGEPAEPVPSEPAAVAPQADARHEAPSEFIRDLIAAMRTVADEARKAGLSQLRTQADEAVHGLETGAERRRQALRERAEADIAGVGDWARAEAERIKAEAEQRVASRRAQLEQQLAADGTRAEAETRALRARVDDYERELDAYHAQLSEITDPAAFAAAAKRMPPPPPLVAQSPEAGPPDAAARSESQAAAPSEPGDSVKDEVHPAEEEVLAARLAELDAKLETAPDAPEPTQAAQAQPSNGEPMTTDIVVKGLGSFGAITGFRQALANQESISGVALSLGQSGEFVFRATHAAGADIAAAITAVEGDNATVEARPDGGLRVTLERAR